MPIQQISAAHLEELVNKTYSVTLDISDKEDRDVLKLYMETCKPDSTNKSLNEFLEDMFKNYQQLEREFVDIDIDTYLTNLNEQLKQINYESSNIEELEIKVDRLLEYKKFRDFAEDYPRLFTKYQEFTKSEDKNMIVAELTSSNRNYSLGFDPLDKAGDNTIRIRYGNFSGSRIYDVNFSNIEDVNFRDCDFEQVRFYSSGYIHNNDFRGATVEESSFIGFSKEQTVMKSNKFSFADPEAGNKFGFMCIHDEDRIKLLNQLSLTNYENIRAHEMRRLNTTLTPKKSFITSMFTRKSEQVKQYTEVEQKLFEEIERKYNKNISQANKKNRAKSVVSLHDSVFDPTYVPGQDSSHSKIQLYYVSEKDLETFLERETTHSFNAFVTKKITQDKPEEFKDTKIIADFSKLDLQNRDFSNLNLSGVNFAYCNLRGVNFCNCNLQGACFEGAVFDEKTSFKKVDLTDSNLIGVEGKKVDFSESILTRSRFLGASLLDTNFNKAQMYQMNATFMNASHSNFQSVDAKKAKFKESILLNIDARNAKMQMANLEKAILEYSDFSGVDMSNAVLREAKAQRTLFVDTIMAEVNAELANFTKSTMTRVKAENAVFTEAILNEVQAEYANFQKSLLERTQAKLANFQYANLEGVIASESDFSDAIIKNANLRGAYLSQANLTRIQAAHADMTGAILKRAKANEGNFTNAVLDEVDASFAHLNKGVFNGASAEQLNLESAIFSNVTAIDITLNNVSTNEQTILLGSKINAINTPEEFIKRYNEQYLHKTGFFAPSKYGSCIKVNEKGVTKRFELQQLGAQIVGSASGASAGILLGSGGYLQSILFGITGGVLSNLAINAVQQYSYKEQGYIDNYAGDKLAEIGAICKIFGISALDSTKNITLLYSGLKILNLIPSPYINKVNNTINDYTGLKFGLGIVAIFATKNATEALKEIKKYSMADAKTIGLTPEDAVEIYEKKLDNIKEKYLPTANKLIVACTVLAVVGVISTAITGLSTISIAIAVSCSALTYVYDKKITNGISSINDVFSFSDNNDATKMISSVTVEKNKPGHELVSARKESIESLRNFVNKSISRKNSIPVKFVERIKEIFTASGRNR